MYVSTTIPWSNILLETLNVAQLVKKFRAFIEYESSSRCSQNLAVGPHSAADELCPQLVTLFS